MSSKPHEVSPDDQFHFKKALEIAQGSGAPKPVIMWLTDVVVETGNSKQVDQHFITALTKQGVHLSAVDVRKVREHLRELGVSVKLHVDPGPAATPIRDVPPIPDKPFDEKF